jgi:hypothetical protein
MDIPCAVGDDKPSISSLNENVSFMYAKSIPGGISTTPNFPAPKRMEDT